MAQFAVRVVPQGKEFVWMVVDHIWDGISAPIALAERSFHSYEEAMAAGVEALHRIEVDPTRDHPFQD